MSEKELRARIVATARAWLNCNEADGTFRPIIDRYNAIRPLPRGYKMTYSDAWCAAFVSAVGAACGLTSVIYPECACDPMIEAYKARGRWVEDDGYLPAPGDVVFYDWQDDGRGDNTGSSDHVGLVVAVEGSTITVVEGNKSDAVGTRTLQRDGRYIRGFAVPDYEAAAGGASPSPTEEDGTPGAASPTGQTGAEIIDRPDGAVDMSGGDSGLAVDSPPVSPIDDSRVTVKLPVLRYGDGIDDPREDVRAAQLLLIGRGYRCGYAGPDGEYGTQTKKAVEAFQRGYGLAVDGEIGAETWAALLRVTG